MLYQDLITGERVALHSTWVRGKNRSELTQSLKEFRKIGHLTLAWYEHLSKLNKLQKQKRLAILKDYMVRTHPDHGGKGYNLDTFTQAASEAKFIRKSLSKEFA